MVGVILSLQHQRSGAIVYQVYRVRLLRFWWKHGLTVFRYHSTDDQRIPPKFVCIDCRLRADISWELIKSELYPRLMSKYRDLALFRYRFPEIRVFSTDVFGKACFEGRWKNERYDPGKFCKTTWCGSCQSFHEDKSWNLLQGRISLSPVKCSRGSKRKVSSGYLATVISHQHNYTRFCSRACRRNWWTRSGQGSSEEEKHYKTKQATP